MGWVAQPDEAQELGSIEEKCHESTGGRWILSDVAQHKHRYCSEPNQKP